MSQTPHEGDGSNAYPPGAGNQPTPSYDPAQSQAPQGQWGGAQDPRQGWQVQPAGGAPYGGAGGFPGDAGDDPTRPSFYQPNLPPPVPGAQPVSPGDEKLWATLSHVGMIVTGFVGPLVIWLMYKDRSRWLKLHAGEAFNFSILATIVYFVSVPLTFVVIGTVTWAAMGIVALIFGIMAAMAANRGEYKPYPFTVRFFK